jgi:hypothetical protein
MARNENIERSRRQLVAMARQDPGLVLAVILDHLIELASGGGSLLPNRVMQEMVKERFYARLLADLLPRRPW